MRSLTDEDLLCSEDPEAFGLFYDRYARAMLGYFARRTGDPEVAADLTAETFASALVARRRFKPRGAPAGAWLYASLRGASSTSSDVDGSTQGCGARWRWSAGR